MKKLIGISLLALSLAGCATSGGGGGNITETARQIQQVVKTTCAFVPTIQTIVSIINASAGQTLGIANEICAAITSVPLADGGKRKVIVRGVPVAGRRL